MAEAQPAPPILTLADGSGWTLAVRQVDGIIQVIAGPNNVGRVFRPGDSAYTQVVANLAARHPQLPAYLAHLQLGPLPAPGGGEKSPVTQQEGAVVVIPWYKKPLVVAGLVIGGIAMVGGGTYVAVRGAPWSRRNPEKRRLTWHIEGDDDYDDGDDGYDDYDDDYSGGSYGNAGSDWDDEDEDEFQSFELDETEDVELPAPKPKRRSNSARSHYTSGGEGSTALVLHGAPPPAEATTRTNPKRRKKRKRWKKRKKSGNRRGSEA